MKYYMWKLYLQKLSNPQYEQFFKKRQIYTPDIIVSHSLQLMI